MRVFFHGVVEVPGSCSFRKLTARRKALIMIWTTKFSLRAQMLKNILRKINII